MITGSTESFLGSASQEEPFNSVKRIYFCWLIPAPFGEAALAGPKGTGLQQRNL